MGLWDRPNNYVKSNSYDGRFLPSVTRRFGYSLSVTVATSARARVYVRFPHMPGTDKGRREAQNVRPYHALVCPVVRAPFPLAVIVAQALISSSRNQSQRGQTDRR